MVRLKAYVALLRAVNVGGTGKLPMSELKRMCEKTGLAEVKTYIASGNVVFGSDLTEQAIKSALERTLGAYAGKPVGVMVRTAREMNEVLERNPFSGKPANLTAALFVDDRLGPDALDGMSGVEREEVRPGKRVIYIYYPDGVGRSRLRIPAGKSGTARNMNTIAKLAEMASALG